MMVSRAAEKPSLISCFILFHIASVLHVLFLSVLHFELVLHFVFS